MVGDGGGETWRLTNGQPCGRGHFPIPVVDVDTDADAGVDIRPGRPDICSADHWFWIICPWKWTCDWRLSTTSVLTRADT